MDTLEPRQLPLICSYSTVEYSSEDLQIEQTKHMLEGGLVGRNFFVVFFNLCFFPPYLDTKATQKTIPTSFFCVATFFSNLVSAPKLLSTVHPSFMQESPTQLPTLLGHRTCVSSCTGPF